MGFGILNGFRIQGLAVDAVKLDKIILASSIALEEDVTNLLAWTHAERSSEKSKIVRAVALKQEGTFLETQYLPRPATYPLYTLIPVLQDHIPLFNTPNPALHI